MYISTEKIKTGEKKKYDTDDPGHPNKYFSFSIYIFHRCDLTICQILFPFFILFYSIIICKTSILMIMLDEYTNVYLAIFLYSWSWRDFKCFMWLWKEKVLLATFLYKTTSLIRVLPLQKRCQSMKLTCIKNFTSNNTDLDLVKLFF